MDQETATRAGSTSLNLVELLQKAHWVELSRSTRFRDVDPARVAVSWSMTARTTTPSVRKDTSTTYVVMRRWDSANGPRYHATGPLSKV